MASEFFMVARCDGGAYREFGESLRAGCVPSYVHNSRESAEAEAERLANKYPGREFMVLEGVCAVRSELYDLCGRQTQVPIYQAPVNKEPW